MNLNSFLNSLSEISQKVVGFLFNSKWTIPIIVILIVLYFVYLGMKKEKPTSNPSLHPHQTNEHIPE